MNKIFWIGLVLMIMGTTLSIVIDQWFGGILFGAGFVYLLNKDVLAVDTENAKDGMEGNK